MNTISQSNTLRIGSRVLIIVGSIAMVVGAVDPMEGSAIILPGSGLMALGTFLNQTDRSFFAYRMWVFILVAIGVGALWGLSQIGGLGGKSGHSMWWALLMLPYPIGWSMGMWGPGSPRWLLALGIIVGLWYQVILEMVLTHRGWRQGGAAFFISALGAVTIIGCLMRLLEKRRSRPKENPATL